MNEIRGAILETISDDSYGLWELTGMIHTVNPDLKHPDLQSAVQKELLDLLRDGLIEVLRRSSISSPETAISGREAVARIADERYWRVPDDADSEEIRVAATDSGREVYFGLR